MNREQLFDEILAWLDGKAAKPKAAQIKFDMGPIIGTSDITRPASGDWCGTSCCIAGMAFALEHDFLLKTGNEVNDHRFADNTNKTWIPFVWERASYLLGLSPGEARALFAPWEHYDETGEEPEDWPEKSTEITPSWAAATIRRFRATGTIDWAGTREEA